MEFDYEKLIEKESRDYEEKRGQAESLRELTQTRGWKVLEGMLAERIQNHVNAICVEGVEEVKTIQIRARMAELRMLLKLPQLTADELAQHKKRLEVLQARRQRMQSVGLDKLPSQGGYDDGKQGQEDEHV